MSTEYVASETIPSTDFLEPTRYRVSYSCELCGHEWSRVYKVVPKRDPPCPNKRCIADRETAQLKDEMANLKKMLEEQRAPGHIGDNNLNKAWDITQEVVAKDYGMTNLNDRPYEGENMAPKQPPKIQSMIDNFFGGNKKTAVVGKTASAQEEVGKRVMARLSQRAFAGAYRGMAVPPTAISPGAARGQPALKMVRTEPIRR